MPHKKRQSRLPFVQIDIAPGMPEPLEAARKIVALMFDLDAPNAEVAESFAMSISVYDLGAMQISTCLSSASILRRSAALIALTRTDHFIVQFYRTGSFDVTTEAGHVTVAPGALTFFDLSRPCTIVADAVNNLALTVPPDLLLPLVADPHSIHGLALRPDSEANVALTMHLEDLWQRLPDMNPQQAQEESQSLAAMLAAVIGAHANKRSMARAHLRKNQFGAICRWIDANLDNPALEPAAITGKFYITRPTLYRMFERRGGIMKHILERRLEKVFHDLVDQSRRREKIGAIMHRWGLRDHTSAGRAFRSHFGVTPKQVRANLASQVRWPPVSSTEPFRIENIEHLGPLLEKHNARVIRADTQRHQLPAGSGEDG